MATETDFALRAGDDASISGTLAGYTTIAEFTITLGVRPRITAPLAFEKVADIIDAAAGTFLFTIAETDTAGLAEGSYVFDIKVVDAGGIVRHSERGTLLIERTVTP